MTRPVVIGLTGGIGSGKSTVASMFARLGALVVDADGIGHEILAEEVVKQQIKAIWGECVFESLEVSRTAMANIVFDETTGREQLRKLEAITHPGIKTRILEQLKHAENDNRIAVVLDAALLFEAGWDSICDNLVFVKTNEAVRIGRIIRRGWTKAEFFRREQRQLPVDEKESRSSDLISNSNAKETTFSRVVELWKHWDLEFPSGFEHS